MQVIKWEETEVPGKQQESSAGGWGKLWDGLVQLAKAVNGLGRTAGDWCRWEKRWE